MAHLLRTLVVLIKKNLLLRFRARSRTVLELLLPMVVASLFISIWGIMMASMGTYGVGPPLPMPTTLGSGGGLAPEPKDGDSVVAGDSAAATLGDSDTVDRVGVVGSADAVRIVNAALGKLKAGSAVEYATRAALEQAARDKKLFCGVEFSESDVAHARFNYSIRFDEGDIAPTDSLDPGEFDVRQPGLYNTYLTSGFLALQREIDREIVTRTNQIAGAAGGAADYVPASRLRAYTVRTYAEDRQRRTRSFNRGLLPYVLAAILALVVAGSTFTLTSDVATETEKGTRGALMMMGTSAAGYILSHGLTSLLFLVPSFLAVPGVLVATTVPQTSWGVLVIVLAVYAVSVMALAFVVLSFVRSATAGPPAAVFTSLAFLAAGVAITVASGDDFGRGGGAALLAFVASPVGLAFAAEIISHRELAELATSSLSAACPTAAEDVYASRPCMAPGSLGDIVGLMFGSTLLYTLVAWYLSEVLQGGGRRWYFLVQPSFWTGILGIGGPGAAGSGRAPSSARVGPHRSGGGSGPKTLLSVRSLTREFPSDDGSGEPRKVVNAVSFEAHEGQVVGLLGHNGAGKSTLISMLSGILEPTHGDAEIAGHSIATEMSLARGAIGVCPQKDILWPSLTVREHLDLFANLKGSYRSGDELREDVESTLNDTAMPEKADYLAGSLSGGQKRRLLAAVAFIGGSRVVFLDEPSSGVDPSSRASMSAYIDAQRKGRVIILVSHFLEDVDELADNVVLLSRGRVRATGSPVSLKSEFGLGYALTLIRSGDNHDDRERTAGPRGRRRRGGSGRRSKSRSTRAGGRGGSDPDAASDSLDVDDAPDPAAEAAELVEWVAMRVEGAKLVSHSSSEVCIRVPAREEVGGGSDGHRSLSKLFRDLDAGGLEDRGFKSYGITGTTLQDVFLRLTGEEHLPAGAQGESNEELGQTFEERRETWRKRAVRERLDRRSGAKAGRSYGTGSGSDGSAAGSSRGSSRGSSPVSSGHIAVNMNTSAFTEDVSAGLTSAPGSRSASVPGALDQIWALFMKRVLGVRRVRKLFVHIAVLGFIALAAFLGRRMTPATCTLSPEEKVDLPLAYRAPFAFVSPVAAAPWVQGALVQQNGSSAAAAVGTSLSGTDLINDALIPNGTDADGAVDGYGGPTPASNGTVIVFDAERAHTLPAVQNLASAAALEEAAGASGSPALGNPLLVVRNHPFPATFLTTDAVLMNLNAIVFLALVLGVAFALEVASFTLDPLREVDLGLKLQQRVSGVSTFSYWLGHFAFDWFLCAIVTCAGLPVAFSLASGPRSVFLDSDTGGAVVLLGVAFAFAAVPFAYIMSLRFTRAVSALGSVFGTLMGINLLFVIVIVNLMVQFALGSVPLIAARITTVIFGAMSPVNALLVGLMQLANIVNIRCGTSEGTFTELRPALDMSVAGLPILILVAQGFLCFALLIAIENRESLARRFAWFGVLAGISAGSGPRRGRAGDDEEESAGVDDPADRAALHPAVRGTAARVLEGQCDHHPVVIRDVHKEFALPGGKVKRAVRGISVSCDAGEILVILGQNGAGKTSLFGTVTGVTVPTSGSVSVCGIDVSANPSRARAHIGVVPQHSALFPRLTVDEHLMLFGRLRGLGRAACRAQADAVARRLDMTDYRNRACDNLSGGMKRRVSLGIALMGSPKVLVIDEVSTGVDPHGRTFLWSALRRLRAEGVAILLTTHALDEADALADRIAIVVDGRILCIGTPRTVRTEHGSGLELTLHAGSREDVPRISSFVDREFVGAELVKERSVHASWRVPGTAGAAFTAVEAEITASPGMITDLLISSQSLEQVFLAFAALARARVLGIDAEEARGGHGVSGPAASFTSPFQLYNSRWTVLGNFFFATVGLGVLPWAMGLTALALFGCTGLFARTHGLMSLRCMALSITPFGRNLGVPRPELPAGPASGRWVFAANLLWLPAGLVIAGMHILAGCLNVMLVVTFPFAKHHFRLAQVAVLPFGREIRPARDGCCQCGPLAPFSSNTRQAIAQIL